MQTVQFQPNDHENRTIRDAISLSSTPRREPCDALTREATDPNLALDFQRAGRAAETEPYCLFVTDAQQRINPERADLYGNNRERQWTEFAARLASEDCFGPIRLPGEQKVTIGHPA